ncbi:hypothetical protein WJX74_010407 [Apatococcus lobatus]|uniref:PA14 domain-containing protein n=1 Tax=Apatococcus lobatus TaxID=904363 RepID=A0AAW1SH87_9CHLO
MSAQSYVGTTKSNNVDSLRYFLGGHALGTADLPNTAGFVTAADAPNADWAQTVPTVATFIRNKPTLATVATSGSASDLTTGTLPAAQLPYHSADLITDGVLSLARLPIVPAAYVAGLAPLATEGDLWTGNNQASLVSGYGFPLGPGGLVAWNRDSASGMTAFANNRGTKSPGGWEWVGYRADGSQENVAATLSTSGTLTVTGGLAVGGRSLAAVALSGSASDITTGTLPASVLPPTSKSSVSGGAFSSGLNPDTTNAYLVGSASYQWKAVYAQTLYQNGQALAPVALSGSAGDLTTGTLAVARLPPVPAQQIGSGSFTVGSFAASLTPAASATYDLGSATLAWRNGVFTGTLTVGGQTVQTVALSGSAGDLTSGTLSVGRLPALPASQVTSGAFTVGSFATSLTPTGTAYSLGSAANPWLAAYATNVTFGGVLTGGSRTDRCQLGLCGSNLAPSSTSYFGLGIGQAPGGTAAQALEYHVDGPASDHVWYANTTELFRMTGGGASTASMLPGANGGQTLGAFNKQWLNVFAQGFFMNGLPLQQVCVTASASDIQQGVLPLAQVPALPASRVSVQSGFSIDLVPATAGSGNVGTSTSPWANVWATQVYRNGVPLAAVATSGNLADLNQPFSTGNQQPYNTTQAGSYLYYGRVAGTGTTTFATQRGSSSTGGFEFLTYSGSAVEGVSGGPLLTLDKGGNATVAGGVKAMGAGGLLVRSFDELATYAAGANTFRFQGRPLDSQLVSSVSWASGSLAFGPASQTGKISVRVSGYLRAPTSDTYTFQVTFKDGVRVWLGNLKVVDSWSLQSGSSTTTATFTQQMGAGAVPFMVECFVGTGPGTLQVQWKGAANNTAYQTLAHGTGLTAMSLLYDMYENPSSQMGTLWCNGPVFAPSINNNGGGVSIADKVDMAGNPLTGVSFLSNNGSAMTVNAPLNLFGNAATNLGSLGVGVSGAPAAVVDVAGKSNGLGQLHLTASDLLDASIGFGGTQSAFGAGSAWVMGRGCYNAGTNFSLGQQGPGGILYVVGGSSPAVGINQAVPGSGYSLDVLGAAHISGTLYCDKIVSSQVQTTSSSSQTSIASTLYVVQGTGVGINTQSPGAALDVTGTGNFTGALAAPSVRTPAINPGSTALNIGSTVYVAGGTTPLLGVNQPSPSATLDVKGTANVTGTVTAGSVTTASVVAPSSGTLTIGQGPTGSSLYVVGNSVGVFQSSPQYTLDVAGSANVSNSLSAQELDAPAINGSGQALRVCAFVTLANGKMGVGQTSPQATVDVTGTLRATTSLTTGNVETSTVNSSGSALTIGAALYLTAGSSRSLGVFNSSPTAALDVTGSVRASGLATLSGGTVTPTVNAGNQALAVGTTLYVSGAGVGVFQSSPTYGLDVSGTARFTGSVTAGGVVSPSINTGNQALTIGNSIYVTGGSSPMVGIMTPSPGAALDVTGSVRSSVGVTAPALVGNTLNPTTANGSVAVNSALFVTATGVGVYAASPGASLDVNGTGRFSTSLSSPAISTAAINAGGAALQLGPTAVLTSGGRLGVNQTNPAATLDVNGTANFTGAVTAGSVTSSSVGSTSGTSTVSGVITVQQSSQSQGAAVGILQPAPQYTLDVTGNARVTQNAVVSGGITTPQLSNSGSGLAVPEVVTASGLVVPSINPAGQNLQLGKGVTLLTPSGASAPLIGICNTSPSTQLDVTGSAKVSGSVTAGSAVLPQINAGDQALQVGSNVWVSSKMVGVGKTPTVPLDVVGAVTATGLGTLSGGLVTPVINGSSQALNVANAITVTGGSSPLVGVLNGNPKSALDVTGNAAVSGSVTSASLTCAQINQAGGALTVASMLYMPGGAAPKLGILQSTPAYTLDVAGNGRFTQGLTTPALQLGNEALKVGSALWTTAGTTPSVGICNPSPQSTLDVTGSLNVSQGAVVGGLVTPVLNGGNQALQVGSAVWVTASSPPKVGVLQANPTTALDVLGSVNASTSVITPTVNGGAQPLDLVAGAVSVRASAVGLFTTTPGATLDVQGGGTLNVKTSATAPAVYCSTINSGKQSLTVSGGVYVANGTSPTVGINVAAPNAMLHVSNDIRSSSLYTGTVNSDGASLSMVAGNYTLTNSSATLTVPTTIAVPSNNVLNLQGAANQGQQVFLSYGSSVATNMCGYVNWFNAGGSASNPVNSVGIGLFGQAGNALTLTAAGTGVSMSTSPSYTFQVGNGGDTNRTAYVGGTLNAAVSMTTPAAYVSTINSNSAALTVCSSVYFSNSGSPKVGVNVSQPNAMLHVSNDIRSSSLYTSTVNADGSGLSAVNGTLTLTGGAAVLAVPTTIAVAQNRTLALQSTAATGQLSYMTLGNSTDGSSRDNNNCAYINWANSGGSGSASNSISLGMWGEAGNAFTATANGVAICSTGTAAYTFQVGNVGDTTNSAYVAGTLYTTGMLQATGGVQAPFLASPSANLALFCGPTNAGSLAVGTPTSNSASLQWTISGVSVPGTLTTPKISNSGNGVNITETTTVPKLKLPQASSFTGCLSELNNDIFALMPTGVILPYAATAGVPPTGYLFCDGKSYNTQDYPQLYYLIGIAYGQDSGKFRVPDMRSRIPGGYNSYNSSGSYVPLAGVLGLAYDMYENPGTQFGTSNFLNGLITARLSNGGQGITVPEPVAFGGNALTGVASIANGGNGLTVSEATNFGGRALSGVASLANSGAGISSSEPLSLGGAVTSSSILSFGQPAASPCLVSLFATGLPTRATTAFYGFGTGTNALAYRVPSSTQDHVFYAGTTEVGRMKGTGGLAVGTITNGGGGLTIAENVAFGGKALSGVASLANGGAGISIPESVAFGGRALTGVASLANGGNGVAVPENVNLASHALSGVLSIANGGNGLTVSESITMGGRSILGVASLTNAGNGISVGEAVNFGAHALKGVASLANGGSGISVSENVAFGGNALTGVASLANGGSGVTVPENVSFGGNALSRVASVANGGSGISIPETVNLGTHGITGVSSLGNGGAGIAVYETLNLSGNAITAIAQLDNAGSGVTVNDTLSVVGAASLTSAGVSGNASVTGTLTVTGTSSVSGLTASGSVSSASLTVSGSSTLGSLSCSTLTTSGNATVGGTFRATGAATLSSTLSVTGASTLAAVGCTSFTASGTLAVAGTSTLTGNTVVGATTAASTSVLVQTSQTGSASVGMDASYSYGASMGINSNSSKLGWCVGSGMGTYAAGSALMVLSAAAQLGINTTSPGYTCDVNGTLRATGAAQMQTTLTVVGASTLAGATCTALTVNGNGTVSGTLGVGGATTLSSTLSVTGATTMAGASCTTLSASGNATLSGTLSVTGSSTLTGGLTVTGTSSLAAASCSTLTTTGTASVGGTLTVAGRLTVNNGVTVAGGAAGGAGNRLQITGGGSSGSTTGIDLSTYAGGPAPCFSLTATDLGNGIDALDLLQFTGSGSTQASRLRVLGNGNVGLGGQTNPQNTLDVTGGGNFTGSLGVGGTSTLSAATLSGTLNVTGASTMAGTTCSTLTVTGGTTLSTVTVTGNCTTAAFSASSLAVTGSSVLAGVTCSTLGASGNTTVGGSLGVTGGASMSSSLSVTGTTTVSSLTASGSATLNGTLTVAGPATLNNTLSVVGASTLASATASTLTVTGASTLGGKLTVTSTAVVLGGVVGGPGYRMQVFGAGSPGSTSGLDLSTFATSASQASGFSVTVSDVNNNQNSLDLLQCTGPGTAQANRLHLHGPNGYIGLGGQTNPQYTLDVTGNGNFSGNLAVGGNLVFSSLNLAGTLSVSGSTTLAAATCTSLGVTGLATLASAVCQGVLQFQQVQNQVVCLYTNDSGGAPSATSTNFFGLGTGSQALRYQVPSSASWHAWYSGAAETMRLTATGLGISTQSPAYTLDVAGPAHATQVLVGTSTDTSSQRAVSALQSGLPAGGATYITLGQSTSTNNQAEMAFNYAGSGSASNALSLGFYGAALTAGRLFFTAGGQLGVGTSVPAATCDVIGTLRASGAASLSSSLTVVGTTSLAGTNVTGALTVTGTVRSTGNLTVSGGTAAGPGPRVQVLGGGSSGSTTGIDMSTYANAPAPCFSLTATDLGNGTDTLDLLQFTGTGTTQASRLRVSGTGNIGLGGQLSPAYPLDVTGVVRATQLVGLFSGESRNDPLDQSVVLQYTFRAGSGTTVLDKTASLNNGTVSGNFSWSSANPFDGLRGTYLALADGSAAVVPSSPFGAATTTATCWYNPGTLGNQGAYAVLFCNGPNLNMLCVRTSDYQVGLYNNAFFGSGVTLTAGSWYHLAVTVYVVGSTVLTGIYVNSRQVMASTSGCNPATYPITCVGNTVAGSTASTGQGATGRLADVRVWSRTLSTGEMEMVYSQSVKPVYRDVNTGFVGVNLTAPYGPPQYAVDVNGSVRASAAGSFGGALTVTGASTLSGGASVTGAVTATSPSRFPQLLVGTSADTDTSKLVSALQSGLATGVTVSYSLGQAATTNNQAELGFLYNGSGSTTNTCSIGFYGSAATNRLWYTAAGNLGLGVQAPSYALDAVVPSTTGASYYNGAGNAAMATGWSSLIETNPYNGVLTIRTSAASASANALPTMNAAVVVDPSGKVGVFKTPTVALDVLGACKTSADTILNTAAVGSFGYGNWAGLMYSGLPTTGYAVLQSAGGLTSVNNVAGQGVLFRDSNVTGMTYTNAALRVGDAATPTATLDIAGPIKASGAATLASTLAVGGNLTVSGGVAAGAGPRVQVFGGGSSGSTTGIDLSTYANAPAPCFSLTATDLGNGTDSLDLLQFTGTGTTQASRLRVSGTGNIGLGGQTNPAQTLDVAGVARANQILVGTSTDSTSQRAISALNSALTAGGSTYITLGQGAATNNEAEFCFNYAGSGSASNTLSLGFYNAATRLWYTAGGLLGVNNATPASTCDVAGSFRATGRVAMERSDDPIDNGCVLQYTFREGSGSLVNDRSVSGNDGTLSGTYTWSGMGSYDGLRGAYISFTNSTGLLSLANPVASANQTVSLWYNPSSAATGYTVLVWSAANHNLLTFNGADMTLGYYNGSVTSTGVTLAFGQWYHICVSVVSSTPFWSLSVNGRNVYATSSAYSTATYPTSSVGNFPGGNQAAQGKIEDVRIWSRCLSGGEIGSLYQRKANLFRDPATGLQAFLVTWTAGAVQYQGATKAQAVTFPTSFGQSGAIVHVQVVGTPQLTSMVSAVTATGCTVTLANNNLNTAFTPTGLMVFATLGSPSSVPTATF